ncbi:MAG: ferritin-like domain-containing protein [Alphaproteobacteria bacterium]|nr:ferritin-like domain-containing protein [Alphaproteobacteria bacterium]
MSDVYSPPKAKLDADDPEAQRQRYRVRLPWLLLGAAGIGTVCFFVLLADVFRGPVQDLGLPVLGFGATALYAAAALTGLVAVFVVPAAPMGTKVALLLGPTLTGGFFSFLGMGMTFIATFGFSRGRQLRRRGEVLLPPVEPVEGWDALPLTPEVEAPERAAVAAAWRENARTEHASVAAFARLTLEMMALGAPSELIAAAQKDAEEELRHTHLCFSLARGFDGHEAGPGAFPGARLKPGGGRVRSLSFARLAVESLVDGALNEGVSARIVGRLARQVSDPAVKSVLSEIASDEGRHAVHGWEVLAWCLEQEPAAVGAALSGAIRALPTEFADTLPEGAVGGDWERYGIPGQALADEEYAKTRDHVVRRVERMLGRVA